MVAVSAFVISQKIEKSCQCGWVLASTHTLQERTLEKKDSEAGIAPMKSLSAKCDHAVRQWGVFSQPHQCSRSSAGEHPSVVRLLLKMRQWWPSCLREETTWNKKRTTDTFLVVSFTFYIFKPHIFFLISQMSLHAVE